MIETPFGGLEHLHTQETVSLARAMDLTGVTYDTAATWDVIDVAGEQRVRTADIAREALVTFALPIEDAIRLCDYLDPFEARDPQPMRQVAEHVRFRTNAIRREVGR